MSAGDRPPSRTPRPSPGPLHVGEIVERLKLDRSRASAPATPRVRPGRIITGRLEEHGHANYQFRADANPSYYVKILSNRGMETLWGVDLERAIKRSKTKPEVGSVVGAQRVGSELVTLPSPGAARGAASRRTARRAQWVVESITFFAESMQRARRDRESRLADEQALREHPVLRSAFISLHVAEKFAERNIRDPRDRETFIARVKAVMALSARSGKSIPEPRLLDRTRGREDPAR